MHIGRDTTLDPGLRNRLDRPPLFARHPGARASSSGRPGCVRGSLADRRLGDDAERTRGGIGGFIDVEIEVPTLALSEREQNVEALAEARGS